MLGCCCADSWDSVSVILQLHYSQGPGLTLFFSVVYCSSADTPSPDDIDPRACWVSIGVLWTLPSILIFGKCLHLFDIDEQYWGYFRLIYQFMICFLYAAWYIIYTFFALFDAGRVAIDHFRFGDPREDSE